ncbi:MAG: hypothetical protein WBM98_13845 [Maribacter sp.]|uniref:hypothetical protein n=1 Tax=Maribacter sp. TaxID=1897614 RepID=UPI003C7717A1
MAKILSVELKHVPKHIHVGDAVNDIIVLTKIQFHPLDLQLQMPYCLHLFVYDIHGNVDAPLVLPNWDESRVLPVASDRKDDFMGQKNVILTANEAEMTIETPIALSLGKINRDMSYMSRKIEVFATMAPVVGRVSKYSEPFTSMISY